MVLSSKLRCDGYNMINDYPHSVPYETIPSVAGFSLVLSHILYAFLWHLYFLLMPKRKYQRKGQSYRQRQRPAGIALFLTGMGSFFGCCRRFSSCQKRRSLLRRDHSLRSGVPRGRPVPEQKKLVWLENGVQYADSH